MWRELQSAGWLCVKHGEQQRNHYLLPLGEECRDNVRNGSYVKSITADDGSSRAVYRTRGEVEQHVCLGKGPLSAILASPNVLPAAPPVHTQTKPAAPSVRAPNKRGPAEPAEEPMSVGATTATRSGRTVKKLRPLEAPGANGEAQMMNAGEKSIDSSTRTTVQIRAESAARASMHVQKQPTSCVARSEVFLVEAVLDSRRVGSTVEYLVKWAGFGPSENTWEPTAHLDGCVKLREFKQAQNKPKKKVKKESAPVKQVLALRKADDLVDVASAEPSSIQHAKKHPASSNAHRAQVLRWTSGHEAIRTKENGVVRQLRCCSSHSVRDLRCGCLGDSG